MLADLEERWASAAVVPLVDGADWDAELFGEVKRAEQPIFGHILTVRHTICHCQCVARKSEGSDAGPLLTGADAASAYARLVSEERPIRHVSYRAAADVDEGFSATLVHHRFPGVQFVVTIDKARRLVGFQAHHTVPGEMLTARQLRSVPVGELHDYAVGQLRVVVSRSRSMSGWADTFTAEHHPGRQGRPDAFYAALSASYVERLAAESRAPIRDLADAAGLSSSQVRNLLYEARRRELLSTSPKGRAGGELTEKAKRLLIEED